MVDGFAEGFSPPLPQTSSDSIAYLLCVSDVLTIGSGIASRGNGGRGGTGADNCTSVWWDVGGRGSIKPKAHQPTLQR